MIKKKELRRGERGEERKERGGGKKNNVLIISNHSIISHVHGKCMNQGLVEWGCKTSIHVFLNQVT